MSMRLGRRLVCLALCAASGLLVLNSGLAYAGHRKGCHHLTGMYSALGGKVIDDRVLNIVGQKCFSKLEPCVIPTEKHDRPISLHGNSLPEGLGSIIKIVRIHQHNCLRGTGFVSSRNDELGEVKFCDKTPTQRRILKFGYLLDSIQIGVPKRAVKRIGVIVQRKGWINRAPNNRVNVKPRDGCTIFIGEYDVRGTRMGDEECANFLNLAGRARCRRFAASLGYPLSICSDVNRPVSRHDDNRGRVGVPHCNQ